MYLYDLTKYPKLFCCVYWGRFKLDNFNNDVDVFENRNKFVEEFKITKVCKMPKYVEKNIEIEYKKNIIDHLECYRTDEKDYILVSSPYGNGNENIYLENGWIVYNKLYLSDVFTYIKIIPMRNKKI